MKINVLFRILKLCYLFKVTGSHSLLKETQLNSLYLVFAIGLFFIPSKKRSNGKSLCEFFERAGVLTTKLGQMLSTQQSFLPEYLIKDLIRLQNNVSPMSYETSCEIIKKDFITNNIDISKYNLKIDKQIVACASIAQVMSGTIEVDGLEKDIVIKFLRPNLKKQIDLDFDILSKLTYIIDDYFPQYTSRLRLQEIVQQFNDILKKEINLNDEAMNLVRFYEIWNDSGQIQVPYLYQELSNRELMVMERIYGSKIYEIVDRKDLDINYKSLAEMGVSVFLKQVFEDNFFHADMHPGNIMFDIKDPSKPSYIALDFGNIGILTAEDKKYLAENLLAFFNRDYRKVAQLHVNSGWSRGAVDIDKFERSIHNSIDHIFNKPLYEISFAEVLHELFNVANNFNLEVQPGLLMLQRTLVYVEGMGRTLYKELNLWETAKPHIEKWVLSQYQIIEPIKELKDNISPVLRSLAKLPDRQYLSQKNQERIITMLEQQQIRNNMNFNKIKSIIYWFALWNSLFLTLLSVHLQAGWITIVPVSFLITLILISIIKIF